MAPRPVEERSWCSTDADASRVGPCITGVTPVTWETVARATRRRRMRDGLSEGSAKPSPQFPPVAEGDCLAVKQGHHQHRLFADRRSRAWSVRQQRQVVQLTVNL